MGLQNRIIAFIKYKGTTKQAFEEKAGLSNAAVSKMGDGTRQITLEKISNAFPELDMDWVKTGKGSMLRDSPSEEKNPLSQQKKSSSEEENPTSEPHLSPLIISNPQEEPKEGYKLVPLYNLDSVGGVWSENAVVDTPEYVKMLIPFPDAKEGDIAVEQSGNSMINSIPPGSLILLRPIENWKEYIGYGSTCVLLLRDGRRITKEIQAYTPDPEKYLLCVSHNDGIAPEPLPKSFIVGVWKVIKVLVDHGW